MNGTAAPWFFFIGTEAELIKVFPVILEARGRGVDVRIIASGQNDIASSRIFRELDCGGVDLALSEEREIHKSAAGLLRWWIRTERKAAGTIRAFFPSVDFASSVMIVHGDTVSTFMGARTGKKLGMPVCHIEAGLRSHHLLNPFPEEIDRMLTSRLASFHFAPGTEAVANLKRVKGTVVNTGQNTLLDSLRLSRSIRTAGDVRDLLEEDYFVFVMHRQENLARREFVASGVREIAQAAEERKCVFLLHEITRNALIRFGLMKELERHPGIILHARVDYFDFMKLLEHSAFVITDGGSNQEELYYMNKPCLILRRATERSEGLGINARLFSGRADDISAFVAEMEAHRNENRNPVEGEPSRIIVDALMKR